MILSQLKTSAATLARSLLLMMVSGLAVAQVQNCSQPRFTGQAPADYLAKENPLLQGAADPKAAESLFLGKDRAANCAICHGTRGDGWGPLASQYDPPPRNFACDKTIAGVPAGQLFWIIRFGSPGTAMPPHPHLKDEQIWQLVLYLRQLSK